VKQISTLEKKGSEVWGDSGRDRRKGVGSGRGVDLAGGKFVTKVALYYCNGREVLVSGPGIEWARKLSGCAGDLSWMRGMLRRAAKIFEVEAYPRHDSFTNLRYSDTRPLTCSPHIT
jgi:hypothetical protein